MPGSRRWAGLIVLCAAMFISGVDMTIINIALPDISADLGAGIDELQWIVDAFLVALAALILIGSGLADRFGRRRVFRVGFAAFALTSLLAALAETPGELIAARALMGAATACIMPPALSLLAVIFPPELRPKAVGIWATVGGVAIALGPGLGGVLVQQFGWQSVFLLNVPVALAVLPAAGILLPESRRPGVPPLDLAGAAISALGLGAIVFALIESPAAGWGDPVVLGAFVLGAAALVAFVIVERRRSAPLFDVGVLARPRVACGAIGIITLYASLLGVLFLLPQYLQYVHDRSPIVTGLALLPMGVGLGAVAPFTGGLLQRLGARRTLAGGLIGLALSCALLVPLGRETPIALVFVAMGSYGVFFAVTISPATAVIMNDVGLERTGDGAAVNQLARQAGGALGVAGVGSLFAAVYRARIDDDPLGLAGPGRSLAAESIEDAARVAGTLSHGMREALLAAADDAFDAAARIGIGLCAVLLLGAASVCVVWLGPGNADR